MGLGCLSFFCFLRVFNVFFYFYYYCSFFAVPINAKYLFFLYCFGVYILGGFSRHVKSAHPPTNLLSRASHVVVSLQVSSFLMIFPGFIFLIYWGWFQA